MQKAIGKLNDFFWLAVAGVKPLAPLLARLVIGQAFVQTGIGKWQNFAETAEFFASLGLPAPAAHVAVIATLEAVGGMALIAGLGTNLFAALLSSTMVVALLTADRATFVGALTGAGDSGFTDITPIMFLMPLVFLVVHGAGPISLDFAAKKILHLQSAEPKRALA